MSNNNNNSMDNLKGIIRKTTNTSLFNKFLPLMTLLAGGTYIIMQFQHARYKYRKDYQISDEEANQVLEKYGEAPEEEKVLYTKATKQPVASPQTLNDWVNVRGPRLEEYGNNKNVQQELRQQAISEHQEKLKAERERKMEIVKEKNEKRWEEEHKLRSGVSVRT